MKTKHAPGPWKVTKWGPKRLRIFELFDSNGRMLCSTAVRGSTGYDPLSEEEDAQNFLLLAAAPEIADCLEAILEITCGKCAGGDERCITPDGLDACLVAQQAKAALAKAKGE